MEKTLGIDVSKWQDNNSTAQKMDFVKAYNSGARFVFIKSSQALYQDEDILYNWKSAKDAGLLRGAYHFLDWVADPVQQARYAWSLIQSDPGELPPVCDFESWGTVPADAENKLWAYITEMERLSGRIPMIYTGTYFWKAQADQLEKWAKYPLWVASYTTQSYMELNVVNMTPWDKWTFWQYSSKGDGLLYGAESLSLDMDFFNGSLEELKAFANIVLPPVTVPDCTELMNTVYGEVVDLQNSIVTMAGLVQADVNAEINDTMRELNEQTNLLLEKVSTESEALRQRVISKLTELQMHMNSESEYIKGIVKPGG